MHKDRIIRIAIFVLPAICLLSSFIYPVAVYSDSAFGLFVWRSMLHGAPFNSYATPDPLDPVRDIFTFQSWWSPGQYFVPGLISLTGVSMGRAIWLTVAVASLSGLVGCYYLYNRLGFSPNISRATCLIMILSRSFTLPFHTYNGGEILLFGFIPWAILAALRLRRLAPAAIPALILLFVAGAFLKHSFFITALAILAALVWGALRRGEPWPEVGRLTISSGLIFGIFFALLHFGYLTRGVDPSELQGGGLTLFPAIYGISAPLLNAASFGEVIPRLFMANDHPLVASLSQLWWLYLLLALIAIPVWRAIYLAGSPDFQALMIGFLVVFWVVLTTLNMRSPEIPNEDRYYRPAALVIAPGLTLLLWQQRHRLLRLALAGMLLAGIGYSIVSLGAITWRNRQAPVGRSGLAFHTVTREELQDIHARDDQASPDQIIELPRHDLSLEVLRARVRIVE